MREPLDVRLLKAHAEKDREALVTLYAQAADQTETEDARAFYLTHAYVFALETGHPETRAINTRLVALGREAPLPPDRT
ncbi:MAG: hypothetical protein AAF330_06930 [Pseudomonadota bacterium]